MKIKNVVGFREFRYIFPVDIFPVRNKTAIIFPSKVDMLITYIPPFYMSHVGITVSLKLSTFQPVIGVRPPSSARLFVITGPVGPYYEQKGS